MDQEEEIETTYCIQYTSKSNIKITGQEIIPPKTIIIYNLQFDEDALQNFDSIFEDAVGYHYPVSLLGTYALSPSPSAMGVAAGKLMVQVDSPNSYQSRQIEYTLNDEALLINVTSQNDGPNTMRLTIENSFIFAENFDFDNQKVLQIALLPNDLYKIQLIIKPSGEIQATFRLL